MLPPDLHHEALGHEDDDEDVEEHAGLDQAGQAVGGQQAEREDPVLEHEEAEDLADASRPVTHAKSPISAMANASGMPPRVGKALVAATGSMIT